MKQVEAEFAKRLHSFVKGVCADYGLRHDLQHEPRRALARLGFDGEQAPASLAPPGHAVSVRLDGDALWGRQPGRGVARHPAESRVETKLCLSRAKPMLLDHGPEPYAEQLVAWARTRGMTAILSPYEFRPVAANGQGGYSNSMTGCRPAQPGSGAWRTILASWEPERVLLGWCCLLLGWDELLGRLLGYPHCCTETFARRWPQALREHAGDVAALMLMESGREGYRGPNGWESNVFGRYFGHELIQHFPCRFECQATARLARRNLMALREVAPQQAAEAIEMLRSPVLFTLTQGVALFPGAVVEPQGQALRFDPERVLCSLSGGELGRRVAEANGLIEGRVPAAWLIDFQGSKLQEEHMR